MSSEVNTLDLSYLTVINPELDEIVKSAPPIQPFDASSDITTLRARLFAIKSALTAASTTAHENDGIKEEDRQIPVRDHTFITVRIYSPKLPPTDGRPVFVMYHGGGFCLGGLYSEAALCRKLVNRFGGIVVDVDYRLAPEHTFPTPVYDAYDALKWVAANLDTLGGDAEKGFVVGGISAGANLTATVSHLYRDDGLTPRLTGLYLSIPSLMSEEVVPEKYKPYYLSNEQNKNAPLLDQRAVDYFRDTYKGDPYSPLMSPFIFPSGHNNLPPTYFQICGMDPGRDDSIIYERVLREDCGIKTRADIYPGLPHGIWSWFPNAEFSKKQLRDSLDGMAWLLSNKD